MTAQPLNRQGERAVKPKPTWRCELCGRFYSERTAKEHSYCIQELDRRAAQGSWLYG